MDWYSELLSELLGQNVDEQTHDGLRAQLRRRFLNLYTELLLYVIKSVCLYRRAWISVLGRDLLKLDDWAGELDGIRSAEDALERDIKQFDSAYIRRQDAKMESMKRDEAQLREKSLEDAAINEFLDQLKVTDSHLDKKRIEESKGGLLKDSYRWILDHELLTAFLAEPQGQLLWIKGDPGKGKTMLLCGIIDHLRDTSDRDLSYFFCQATIARLNSAPSVLRGLIYLLVLQRPSLFSHAKDKYKHGKTAFFESENTWFALSEIFLDMLNDPASKGTILIVDALDECTTHRDQLLKVITQASHAKWIISSRDWPEIRERLIDLPQQKTLELELESSLISMAVNMYIEHKVEQLANRRRYTQEKRQVVENHLKSNAHDTFLWVALVCQELEKRPRWHAEKKSWETATRT